MSSPFEGVDSERWSDITRELIARHPLSEEELAATVLAAWQAIFNSNIGPARIGRDIFPTAQIIGFLLHELVPLELQTRFPGVWRTGRSGQEKDIVHIPDDQFSIEVKTSSHPKRIFGNRSYAQAGSVTKKAKSGYYLAINFEKFGADKLPDIVMVRFGWLDSSDWIGQAAPTGQQSRLPAAVEELKLLPVYRIKRDSVEPARRIARSQTKKSD